MLKFLTSLLCLASLSAQMPPVDFSDTSKIAVQNTILAKVNGTTISMMDVKKKMDIVFHQNYPQFADSNQARYQFYESSWRHVLMELIDHELILADADAKEVKITEGDIREELENRFGPNTMTTLDKIGITYEEAWKAIKEDLTVQRMSWWFINTKAMNDVTPHEIRQAFRLYLKENPPYQEWAYRVISIRGAHPEETAEKVEEFLRVSGQSPESLTSALKEMDPSIQVSSEFIAKDSDLSEDHRAVLNTLSVGAYSAPKIQRSRSENKTVARIFYLSQKTDHPAPQFEEMAHNLRNQLMQKAVAKESTAYLEKLRKQYGFDPSQLKEKIPEDLHPFSLQ